MKNFALALCIAGSALALTACESTNSGNTETAVPYTSERTASHGDTAQAEARNEQVFSQQQKK